MITLQIGEQQPFRLSYDKGHRIVNAICACNATVVAAMIDTTAPATHVVMRFEMPRCKMADFRQALPEATIAEMGCGQ